MKTFAKISPLLFLVILLIEPYIVLSWESQPRRKGRSPTFLSRTGSLLHYNTGSFGFYIIHPNHRKNEEFINNLIRKLRPYAHAPRKHNIKRISSKYLGTVAIWMLSHWEDDVYYGYHLHQLILKEFGKRLTGYKPNGEDWYRHYQSRKDQPPNVRRALTGPAPPSNRHKKRVPRGYPSGLNSNVRQNFTFVAEKSKTKEHYKRDTDPEIIKRRVRPEVSILSTPLVDFVEARGHPIAPKTGPTADNSKYYYSHKNSGKNVRIYVSDSGFDPSHSELKDINIKDWIFAGPFPYDSEYRNIDVNIDDRRKHHAHGSSVVAKIAGRRVGVAQAADIVIVQASDAHKSTSIATFADIPNRFDALLKILDHHADCQLAGQGHHNGIVLFTSDLVDENDIGLSSRGSGKTKYAFDYLFLDIVQVFNKIGLAVVMASGNIEGESEFGNGWPVYLMERQDEQPNLVLVGGAANEGNGYLKTLGVQIQASLAFNAPADPVLIPTYFGPEGKPSWELARGNSFAAPVVAGLLACAISQTPQKRISDIIGDMWRNHHYRDQMETSDGPEFGPSIVFNGIFPHMRENALEMPDDTDEELPEDIEYRKFLE